MEKEHKDSMIDHRQKFFDYHATNWHQNIQIEQKIRLRSIFEDLVPVLRAPFLDLGCGTGILLPFLNEFSTTSEGINEVDLSKQMLIRNKEEHNLKYPANYIQASAEDLPFKSGSFGSIVVFAAYAHFQHRQKTKMELFRTLQPKGILIILHLFGHKELNQIHHRAGKSVKRDRLDPVAVLADQLNQIGFEILKTEESVDLYLAVARKG